MKKFMKITTLFICACLVLTAFAGCSGTGTPAENSASPSPSSEAQDENAIVMGTNAEFFPFEYVGDNGIVENFTGIDVAIANEIAKELGKELKVENMEFDSLPIALKTDKIDFAAAGMTITEDRKQNVDFSDTYYSAKQVIIVKEDSDIASAADLTGKNIGVVMGYTGDILVSETLGLTPQRFKKGTDAVMDLVNGRLDAVVIDLAPANAYVEKNPGLKTIEDPTFETEEYAIAVKKGNTELLETINTVLQRLKDDGSIERFAEEYSKQ